MSVGANSIKRAAAAVEEPRKAGAEGTLAESAESGSEKKEAGMKSGAGTDGAGRSAKAAKAPGKTAQKKREPKAVKGRTPQRTSAKAGQKTPAAPEGDAAGGRQADEAYGIGQQLPVYLL